ncbi:unnamed protein product [Penicillium salamii]|nr:unnamed protein product [Penicillium salamii]
MNDDCIDEDIRTFCDLYEQVTPLIVPSLESNAKRAILSVRAPLYDAIASYLSFLVTTGGMDDE